MGKLTENRAVFEANHYRRQYLASESKYWHTLEEKDKALVQLKGTARHFAVKSIGMQHAIADLVARLESDPERAIALARDLVDRHVAAAADVYVSSGNEKLVLAVLEDGSIFSGLNSEFLNDVVADTVARRHSREAAAQHDNATTPVATEPAPATVAESAAAPSPSPAPATDVHAELRDASPIVPGPVLADMSMDVPHAS